MTAAGLLVLMGSGETSPTMTTPHQQWFRHLDGQGAAAPALLLDTPYGFQENREELNAKAVKYFATSVGRPVDVASYRATPDADPIADSAALARIGAARWLFAGPGSPTYALARWSGSGLAEALRRRLDDGGVVIFASAAALTLGAFTVPVYEIYKCGAPPVWQPGLDVVAAVTGLSCAVIPHYDNAEGGHHDTRFCYLGERRLAQMEGDLPEGSFVLGIDEHTALVLDLQARTGRVVGRGAVTIRVAGVSTVLPTGTTVTLAELAELGRGGGSASPGREAQPAHDGEQPAASSTADVSEAAPSLADDTRRATAAFDAALRVRDVDAAVRAVLDLEDAIAGWAADTLQSDDTDQARAALRAMVVRLGEVARSGAADPRDVVGPYVEALLAARRSARDGKRYAEADAVRDTLQELGVEVRDTADGVAWELRA